MPISERHDKSRHAGGVHLWEVGLYELILIHIFARWVSVSAMNV